MQAAREIAAVHTARSRIRFFPFLFVRFRQCHTACHVCGQDRAPLFLECHRSAVGDDETMASIARLVMCHPSQHLPRDWSSDADRVDSCSSSLEIRLRVLIIVTRALISG
jgi:hypothetical protein